MSAIPKLSIVVPCYNEEAVLPETNRQLAALLSRLAATGKIAADSHVIYVDDGSGDATWMAVKQFNRQDPRIKGIKLSGNRGHQAALLAGLFGATGDVVVSIDADLQDDVGAIEAMIDGYASGHDLVYGVRRKRSSDSMFKRVSAESYYKLLALFGVKIVFNHADYRLLSRRALEALKQYTEVNLFLRGIVPLTGFSSMVVYYDRVPRSAGESKYPLRKMLSLALDGITSFTIFPLRMISALGLLVSMGSILMTFWALWTKLFTDAAIPGWASSVLPIYFLGGIQLLSVGVLGEYVGKIYLESKRRPRYFVEEVL